MMGIRQEGVPIAGRGNRPLLDMRPRFSPRTPQTWRYTGPFAGSIYEGDSVHIRLGAYAYGDAAGVMPDTTDGGEVVDLSSYSGDETIYVYAEQRYGHGTQLVYRHTDGSRPEEDRSNGIIGRTVLGVATMVDGAITAWRQEHYGNIDVPRYGGQFSPTLGAADLTTATFYGRVYHDNTHTAASYTLSPGASATGWAYLDIYYDASGVFQISLAYISGGNPPSGTLDNVFIPLGQYATNSDSEFTYWEQDWHGTVHITRHMTYDPVADATKYTTGLDTPLLLEATANNIAWDKATDSTWNSRKGAVYAKT